MEDIIFIMAAGGTRFRGGPEPTAITNTGLTSARHGGDIAHTDITGACAITASNDDCKHLRNDPPSCPRGSLMFYLFSEIDKFRGTACVFNSV